MGVQNGFQSALGERTQKFSHPHLEKYRPAGHTRNPSTSGLRPERQSNKADAAKTPAPTFDKEMLATRTSDKR